MVALSGQWAWVKASGALAKIVDAFFEPHKFSPGRNDNPEVCRICERGPKAPWHTETA